MRIVTAGAAVLVAALAACAGTGASSVPAETPSLPHGVETARTGWPGTITATVVHADGRPVAGAKVRLLVAKNGFMQRTRTVVATDGIGRAVLATEAPGLHRVALEETPGVAPGWLMRSFRWFRCDVDVAPGERVGHSVRLVAPRGGALRVTSSRSGLAPDERISVSVRRRSPSGDLLSCHSYDWPDAETDASGATESRLFEGLPEGDYVVRVGAPEVRTARFHDARVAAGATTVLRADPGPPGPPLEIELAHEVPPAEGWSDGRHRVWLNPRDGGACLVRGAVQPEPHLSRGAGPGGYVAILSGLDAAMAVELREVGEGDGWRVRLRPPAWVTAPPGERTVDVRVLRGHDRLGDTFVALALPASQHLRSGEWMRAHTGGRTRFARVPPGDWDVLVVNGVYGSYAGLPDLTVKRIRVDRDDLLVTVRVPER